MVAAAGCARAAVPAYLGTDFREAAPGHRFYLYLRLWDEHWQKVDGGATEDLVRLGDDDRARMKALAERQQYLADEAVSDGQCTVFALPALSEAPFATGLGVEHPLENGFTFLNPYGLPYLPGSSVKGVLRQAARELDTGGAFENAGRSWDRADIDALFGTAGHEQDTAATTGRRRGALVFWDVHPVLPEGANLHWEIMTPHHRDYYSNPGGTTPPHDNGAPVPILFLTVPVNSRFRFVVQCNRPLLERAAPHLLDKEHWQSIVTELLFHAFDWLGFGAKTAVGYGAMAIDEKGRQQEEERRRQREEEHQRQAELAELSPGERLAAELLEEKTDPNQPEYKYLLQRLGAGDVPDEQIPAFAQAVLAWLEKRRSQIKELRNKTKQRSRLEELEADEQRLEAMIRNDTN